MPTVIDVKMGDTNGDFNLQLIQNWIQLQQKFSLIYYVVADNATQDPYTICKTVGVPQLGTPLYSAFCTGQAPKATHGVIHFLTGALTQLWEVECTFSTMMRDPSTETIPEVSWGGELDEERQDYDLLTGQKITTAAGEPLFAKRQVFYPILTIRRQESWPFDQNTAIRYVAQVNATPFWNFPQGTGMMLPMRVEEDTQNATRVCWVTYEIKFRLLWNPDGTLLANSWQLRTPNAGQMIRDYPGAIPRVNRDVHNMPVICNLTSQGTKLLNPSDNGLTEVGTYNSSTNTSIVRDLPGTGQIIPSSTDIGDELVISDPLMGSWNIGNYLIVYVRTISGNLCWVLQGNIGTPTLVGSFILQHAPQILYFNRAYTAEFNALSLGPF